VNDELDVRGSERRDGRDNLRPVPFEPGNEVAVKHGARAELRLAPRAVELADGLRTIVPAASEADEPTIAVLALVLARIEAANTWLDEHGLFRDGKGNPQPVLSTLSTWENTASRLLDRLGCTPTARARLGLDLALGKGAALRLLDQHVQQTYGDPTQPTEPDSAR
jgi:hypothetical protein